MIKLIASDVDGTILQRGEETIRKSMFEVINKVTEMGILFVIASGRPYCELKHLFEPVMDKVALVCSDGALVSYKGKTHMMLPMNPKDTEELLKDVEQKEDCEFLVYGQYIAYMKPKEEEYGKKVKKTVYNHVDVIDTFKNIKEDYLKVGIYNKKGISCVEDYFLNRWQNVFEVIYSANEWLEFTAPGVNKSVGLKKIMEEYSISQEEAIAFGDSYNDMGMFQCVGAGYAMENAKPELKKIAAGISSRVEDTIIEIMNLKGVL